MELFQKTPKEKIDSYNSGDLPINPRTSDGQPEAYIRDFMDFMADLPNGHGDRPRSAMDTNVEDTPFETDYVKKRGEGFSTINMTSPAGHQAYASMSQKYINARNPNAGITGDMIAEGAKQAYEKTGVYVPPELALAQLALEGGLDNNPNVKPRRTKNPFNVGNTNSGALRIFPSIQEGINKYFDLISTQYLGKGRTPNDLLNNFVNHSGHRYAVNDNKPTQKDYEAGLRPLIEKIHNML